MSATAANMVTRHSNHPLPDRLTDDERQWLLQLIQDERQSVEALTEGRFIGPKESAARLSRIQRVALVLAMGSAL